MVSPITEFTVSAFQRCPNSSPEKRLQLILLWISDPDEVAYQDGELWNKFQGPDLLGIKTCICQH